MGRTRRPTFACARCCKRKKKCDQGYPSCAECSRVGAQCVGLDRDTRSELPRSLVDYLEDLIEQLEHYQAPSNERTEQDGTDILTNTNPRRRLDNVDQVSQLSIAHGAARNSGPLAASAAYKGNILPYLKTLFAAAELPFPLAFKSKRIISLSPRNDQFDPRTLPIELTDKLLATYTTRLLPQHPFLSQKYVLDVYERFKGSIDLGFVLPAHEQFIILMIMAISTLSSRSSERSRLVALAESLRCAALDALGEEEMFSRSTTTNVQLLLLLAHYGFFLPSSTNLWHVLGEAMRMSMELGLHQEVPPESGLNRSIIDSRRRLFWVLYSMERSVAVTSHRPFAVRDDQIRLSRPKSWLDEGSVQPHAEKSLSFPFADRLTFHVLQAEIVAVNVGKRGVPPRNFNYENWLNDMERQIHDAKDHAISNGVAISKWAGMMVSQSTLLLHMPCSQNPEPGTESLLKCFNAAVEVTRGHWEMVQANNQEYLWHAVHNTYEAGILILYILSSSPALIKEQYSSNEVFEIVHQISGFFICVTARWSAVQHCGNLFDSFRKKALRAFWENKSLDPELNPGLRRLKDVVFRENADLLYTFEGSLNGSHVSNESPAGLASPTIFDFSNDADLSHLFDFSEAANMDFTIPVPLEHSEQVLNQTLLGHVFTHLHRTGEPSSSADPPSETQAELLLEYDQLRIMLEQMPVCVPCKKRRIKCDTRLPSCRNCDKYNKACIFTDHVSSREVSREYIHALQARVEALTSQGARLPQTVTFETCTVTSTHTAPKDATGLLYVTNPQNDDDSETFFFGATSAFARLADLKLAMGRNSRHWIPALSANQFNENPFLLELNVAKQPPRETAEVLARIYYISIETHYPTLGLSGIEQVLNFTYNTELEDCTTVDMKIHLCLILAVSFALLGKRDRRHLPASDSYFREASHLEARHDNPATPSAPRLQTALLFCIFAWIRPSSNNLWRLLGHASRMCLDAIEMYGLRNPNAGNIDILYRTLYSLETQVAIAFGRPHRLPDRKDAFMNSSDGKVDPAHDLAVLIYELARLQSRVHREVLARSHEKIVDDFCTPVAPDYTCLDTCIIEMTSWLDIWTAKVVQVCDTLSSGYGFSHLTSELTLRGHLQQSQSLILARSAMRKRAVPVLDLEEDVSLLKRMVDACSSLPQKHLDSSPGEVPFISPAPWTDTHSLFVAGAALSQRARSATPLEVKERLNDLFEKALSNLIAFESQEDQPSNGLSNTLRLMHDMPTGTR